MYTLFGITFVVPLSVCEPHAFGAYFLSASASKVALLCATS